MARDSKAVTFFPWERSYNILPTWTQRIRSARKDHWIHRIIRMHWLPVTILFSIWIQFAWSTWYTTVKHYIFTSQSNHEESERMKQKQIFSSSFCRGNTSEVRYMRFFALGASTRQSWTHSWMSPNRRTGMSSSWLTTTLFAALRRTAHFLNLGCVL